MKNTIVLYIEGADLSGKTTFKEVLKEKLEKLGYSVFQTRLPGGSIASENIRKVILDKGYGANNHSFIAQRLLFMANLANHVDELEKQVIGEYDFVICDRHVSITDDIYHVYSYFQKIPIEKGEDSKEYKELLAMGMKVARIRTQVESLLYNDSPKYAECKKLAIGLSVSQKLFDERVEKRNIDSGNIYDLENISFKKGIKIAYDATFKDDSILNNYKKRLGLEFIIQYIDEYNENSFSDKLINNIITESKK